MKYQYYLFNPRILSDETAELANQVYETWKSVYAGIFDSLHTEDYYRNEIIACIKDMEANKIVAFHMYSCFDSRAVSHMEHRYMEPFTPELITQFEKEGASTYMSLEYLGVNPEYRTNVTGIKFADLTISLGLRVFENSPWDGLLAVARMDYKIHEKAQQMGMRPIGHILRAQYPCELLFLKKNETRALQDPFLAKMVDQLWASKVNYVQLLTEQAPKKRHLRIA
ncbi:hypothetical protein [Bdellovibrio bacteriovorus]|uniref:hypothetical protein n=1 Tax=Bdellovibrio TaxID=958 RepID=UPI0035A86525